jgi:YfiH family protein
LILVLNDYGAALRAFPHMRRARNPLKVASSMLQRVTAKDGVVTYQSPSLSGIGVPHGFSTRIGGVSAGPFESLNLGNPNGSLVQDEPQNIATNYSRFQQVIGCGARERVYVHQVHGDVLMSATACTPFDCNAKADGIICTDPAKVAAVRIADCVPVLLATADGRNVAAVHAGWRGIVEGVVVKAVRRLKELAAAKAGSEGPPPVIAAIGPSIAFDQFEIGPEVAARFEDVFTRDAAALMRPSTNAGKVMLDLRAAIRVQLIAEGVAANLIDNTSCCTYRDSHEFFSHRRENGITGRMAALIGPVG